MRRRPSTRPIALTAALLGALALGFAYVLEDWGGLVPCALCLLERWPYRIVIVLGLVAAILPRRPARVLLALAVVALLFDAAVGFVHVGVEFGWWPSPLPECAAPRFQGGSIADRLASMPDRPAKPCDDPTFLLPGVPVSVAAANMVFALAFAVGLGLSLRERRRYH
ncbi:disulfide bond formation protein B [Rhodopila sp.]|jgi:disulfide bond formation protein DsbB|uniref:disulfide bond formation protein B n=1 Tax=Rhodopila sp. TaxID=2480087 RepID=UPI002C44FAD4|nr:disulfide bond formation protein B [Rhodopila sp.]HVZ09152.1 disulfide bond formation protein B [Rhodopila sp.]